MFAAIWGFKEKRFKISFQKIDVKGCSSEKTEKSENVDNSLFMSI